MSVHLDKCPNYGFPPPLIPPLLLDMLIALLQYTANHHLLLVLNTVNKAFIFISSRKHNVYVVSLRYDFRDIIYH